MSDKPPPQNAAGQTLTRALLLTTDEAFWVDVTGIRGVRSEALLRWLPGSPQVELGLVPAALGALPFLRSGRGKELSHFLVCLSPDNAPPAGGSGHLMMATAVIWHWRATAAGAPVVRVGEDPDPLQPHVVITGSGSFGSADVGGLSDIRVRPVRQWHGKAQALARALEGRRVTRVHVLVAPGQLHDARTALVSALPSARALPGSQRLVYGEGINVLFHVVDTVQELLSVTTSLAPDGGASRDVLGELEEAKEARREALIAGEDSAEIDARIRGLERQLRRGPQLSEGDILGDGRFLLLDVAGTGGFATVWRALDEQTQQVVAVKVLHARWGQDRGRRERFFRGAEQMARLSHPGIGRVILHRGQEGAHHFFVLEYLPGGDLHEAITGGRLGWQRGLQLTLEVGSALSHAHSRGLIHRDVKPQNVLLDREGRARLVDFDLARVMSTEEGSRTGALGTFVYCAPEMHEETERGDERSDVYSLGVTAIFALHGKPLPAFALLQGPDEFITQLPGSTALKRVLSRAVSPAPEGRYPSVDAFLADLEPALVRKRRLLEGRFRGEAARQRRRLTLVVGLLAVALVGAVATARDYAEQAEHTGLEAQAERLSALAWAKSETQPAATLALLRAAASILPNGGETYLRPNEVDTLVWRGASARFIPTRSAVVAMLAAPDGKALTVGMVDGTVASWGVDDGRLLFDVRAFDAPTTRLAQSQDGETILAWDGSLWTRSQRDTHHITVIRAGKTEDPEKVVLAFPVVDALLTSDAEQLVYLDGAGAGFALELGTRAMSSWRIPGWKPGVFRSFLSLPDEEPGVRIVLGEGNFRRVVDGRLMEPATNTSVGASRSGGTFRIGAPSPDARAVALGAPEAIELVLWDTGEVLARTDVDGHEALTFSPDGSRLVALRRAASFSLLDGRSLRGVAELDGHEARVGDVAFVAGSEMLASGAYDASLKLWDAQDGKLIRALAGSNGAIMVVEALGGSGAVASGTRSAQIALWSDVGEDPTLVHALSLADANHYLLEPQSLTVLRSVPGAGVRRISLKDGQVLGPTSDGEHGGPWAMVPSPEGSITALMGDTLGPLSIQQLPIAAHPTEPVRATFAAHSDTGRYLAVVQNGWLRLWGEAGALQTPELDRHGPFRELLWLPGEDRLLITTISGEVMLHDVGARAMVHRLEGPPPGAADLVLSPDGRVAAVSFYSESGRVALWDVRSGKVLRWLDGHTGPVMEAAFSPDGAFLVSVSWDRTARIWDVATGEQRMELRGHTRELNAVDWSKDGARIVTASKDRTLRVWSAEDGELLAVLRGHKSSVREARFADDGVHLISADVVDELRMWRLGARVYEDEDLLVKTGGLTNLRVCERSGEVVAVVPFPPAASVWAPPELCEP